MGVSIDAFALNAQNFRLYCGDLDNCLKAIDIAPNRFGDDLARLSCLPHLSVLQFSSAQVSDLTPLAGFESLKHLDIDDCAIDVWPSGFWCSDSPESVYAANVELAGIPDDLLSTDFNENCLPTIRAHLDDLGDAPECLTDVKLIVLGNGRIGKTQIVNRLRGKSYDKGADLTHGVSLVQASIPGSPDEKFNIWDFGGQGIYFGTHMLFLKSRAVFVLVWTPLSDDADSHEHGGMTFRNQPVAWWLDCIRRWLKAEISGSTAAQSPIALRPTKGGGRWRSALITCPMPGRMIEARQAKSAPWSTFDQPSMTRTPTWPA